MYVREDSLQNGGETWKFTGSYQIMFCVKGSNFDRLKLELFTISKNNHLFHA